MCEGGFHRRRTSGGVRFSAEAVLKIGQILGTLRLLRLRRICFIANHRKLLKQFATATSEATARMRGS
jgi:hypothetical protein